MNLWIDEYAHLDSPLHRWNLRVKLFALFALLFAFSLVQDVRLLPVMFGLTALLYRAAGLPVSFLWSRLRYPGFFLAVMAFILPFSGQTVALSLGPLAIYREGLTSLLLVVSRFSCILTVGLIMFGTAPFLTTIRAMQSLGMPPLLADMMLLSWRYLFEIGETLATMERAMRLRGYRAGRFSLRGMQTLSSLAGSLLVRSYEQSERVYFAMKLRGYGCAADQPLASTRTTGDRADGPAVGVSGLRFSYPNRDPILNGIDLQIQPGERVGLVGPNGAGKTSLFLLLSGVLKPSSGEIALFGRAIRKGTFHPEVGLVFQNPADQLFSPSVRDDVAFGPINMGLSEEEVERRVREALQATGVLDLADRPPHHLSGGEKRMVSIAGVLAMYPQLIIFDEPDANLDISARRRLIRFLQSSPQTLFVASHDLELVLEVCDRVLLLDGGQIVADGPAARIMGDAALMAAHGLEKPHSLVPHDHSR